MDDTQEIDAGRRGISTNVLDAIVALIIFVLGAVVIYGSRKLGSGWTSDGPGAGYFPYYIGLIICISSAVTLYQALLGKNKNTKVAINGPQLKRVMYVLIPAALYVLAIQLLGIYVASALYIAGFMIILGKYSWLRSVIVALAVNVLFFFMFEVWFQVPLFKGTLDPLEFLGY
jgi:hypothetical protein